MSHALLVSLILLLLLSPSHVGALLQPPSPPSPTPRRCRRRRRQVPTRLFSGAAAQHLLDMMDTSASDASSAPSAIWVPGVHDALSARILHQQGDAQALFLSGFGVSAALLGTPDVGIVTYSEMQDVARRVLEAVPSQTCPLIVDGDTGYGSAATLRRAVRGMAGMGVAAMTVEDQAFPKTCAYVAGTDVQVVSREASVARIRTALQARQEAWEQDGHCILIVGRTDCRAALGLNEALTRCQLYQQLGCDLVYAENLQSPEEYMALRKHVPETPLLLAQVQTMGTATAGTSSSSSSNSSSSSRDAQRLYTLQDVTDMGYQIALFGISGLQAVVHALQQSAQQMKQGGIVKDMDQGLPLASLSQVQQVVQYTDWQDFTTQYDCE